MNKNKILLIIVLVLGVVGAYFYTNNKGSTLRKENSEFAVEDTAAITKLFLIDTEGKSVLLERKPNYKWTLNGKYVVRKEAINTMLSTIKQVKVKAPLNESAMENTIKQLAGTSVKIEIYQENKKKPVKVYYVGHANQLHDGTYMLIEGSSRPFLTHIEGMRGFLTPRYFTNENDWRSREIFGYKYGEIKSLKVEHIMYPKSSFQIEEVAPNKFKLTSLSDDKVIEKYDTLALLQYIANYKMIHYEGMEETKDEHYIKAVLATTPQEKYSVTNQLGKTKTLTTYLKPAREGTVDYDGNPVDFDVDRIYATVDDTLFVVGQLLIFDKLNRNLEGFVK